MASHPATAAARRDWRRGSVRAVAVAAAAALVVVLWGGYARGWHWTGFEHNATLWDWLHVFVLPLGFVAGPLWLRHRDRLDRRHHLALSGAAAGFAALVLVGYALHLGWTGFPGNRLWDWLELLLLPLAVGLLPVWANLAGGLRASHAAVLGTAAAFLVVSMVGGYAYDWRWTGFHGNTLFDWLQLLVAPLVLPIVLVPLLEGWMAPEGAADGTSADGQP